MVNCSLEDTSKGTVNILLTIITLYIVSNLPIHFIFTVHTKTDLTSPFLVYRYVSLKHTSYRSRSTFLPLKQYSTSLDEDAIFVNMRS